MRESNITPTGVERKFGNDEIIVSKTDTRGVMTYVNDVFLRIAGYDEHQVLGRPHNLIRHPDMPRSVFKLLWDTVATGEELFAYVVNMASNGDHYWVLAHVTPSFGPNGEIIGYHSNRRVPAPGAVAQAALLYSTLRNEERRHTSAPEATQAGVNMLTGILNDAGITYDEWVWNLTAANTGVR